jgi:midasin (ATPase involved in ribosome maturation)
LIFVLQGYWVVLDELNLAPSEVLEALNRLLDDNRELFIPETQETIKAHPHFMLFATQNPAGVYGGRKVLSKAFRNRFLEIHFQDIPDAELKIILEQRCKIPRSFCDKLISVCEPIANMQRIELIIVLSDYERVATKSPKHSSLCRQAWIYYIAVRVHVTCCIILI